MTSNIVTTKQGQFSRKPVVQTEEVVINPETFTGSKAKPMVVGKFRLYSNQKKSVLYVLSGEGDSLQSKNYELKAGSVYLVERNGELYSYFRTEAFKEFLTKYGFTRVRYMNPNGEYAFREGKFKTDDDVFAISSDGEVRFTDVSEIAPDGTHIYSCRNSNQYVTVSNAKFAIAQQATFRPITAGNATGAEMIFFQRELITNIRVDQIDTALLDQFVGDLNQHLSR